MPDKLENITAGVLLDLFADDGSLARRVLSGDPIVILPVGAFHRGGQVKDITPEVVAQFAANFAQRADVGIRRSQVAVDIDHKGGAVGWYKDIIATDAGLAATFDWTSKGRAVLEAGEYAYFSPTVYWQQTDRETGAQVYNQIAGGAITNFPFFGNATALYSDALASATTKIENELQDPARAYLIADDPHNAAAWQLRVRAFQDGALKLDAQLLNTARAALMSPEQQYQVPDRDAVVSRLRGLYEQKGLKFNMGGNGMSTEKEKAMGTVLPEVSADDFAELRAELDTMRATMTALSGERDVYAAEVGTLKTALALVEDARAVEKFGVLASEFAHLPTDSNALAVELRWLHEQDADNDQEHAAFFMALLRKADSAMAGAFAPVGTARGAQVGSAGAQLAQLVAEYQSQHARATYSDALTSVAGLRPDLYAAYQQEVTA